MDKASPSGGGDCRFESCRGQFLSVRTAMVLRRVAEFNGTNGAYALS